MIKLVFTLLLVPFFSYSTPSQDFIRTNALEIKSLELDPQILSILERYKVIAIGEHHGTDKIPLLVGKIAEALSKNETITLALEIQQANQTGINEYLRTGDPYILQLLAHFAREYQDGRSSAAMVQLLDLARKNKNIEVLAFDPDFNSSGQDRDTKMAQNILKKLRKKPNQRLVVLAGNVHSATKIGNFFDPNYKPMAYELFSLPNSPILQTDILSVMTRYEDATIWGCINDTATDCGPMKFKRDYSNYSTAVSFDSYFLVETGLSDDGYLATLFIRSVAASPPFR